jgi:hypothetical protein
MAVFYTLPEMRFIANPQHIEFTPEIILHPFGTIFATPHGHRSVKSLFVSHDQYVPTLPEPSSRLLSLTGHSLSKRRGDFSL